MEDAVLVASVGAAHQEEDVGLRGPDVLQVVLGHLEGVEADDLGPRAEACKLRRLAGQLRHQAAGDHPQPSGGGGAGEGLRILQLPGLLLQEGEALGEVLLVGGTDGGNKDCVLHNARMLAALRPAFPIVVAGNRAASRSPSTVRLPKGSGRPLYTVFICSGIPSAME